MKQMKIFNLIEQSFTLMFKTTKRIWILGIIISILSGGLILNETTSYDYYPETTYDNEVYVDDEVYTDDEVSIGGFIVVILMVLSIILIFVFVLAILINTVTYYLYKYIHKDIFNQEIESAPLGLVVKVHSIVLIKTMIGLIFFIVPGIIIILKYAPVNYILCKNPELSHKDILKNASAISKGFKWKIFLSNAIIGTVSGVFALLCSLNLFTLGYIWIDLISLVLTFIIMTAMIVYTEIYNMNMFNNIDKLI